MTNYPISFRRLMNANKMNTVQSNINVTQDRELLHALLVRYGIEPKFLSLYLEKELITTARIESVGFVIDEPEKLSTKSAVKFFALLGGEVKNGWVGTND